MKKQREHIIRSIISPKSLAATCILFVIIYHILPKISPFLAAFSHIKNTALIKVVPAVYLNSLPIPPFYPFPSTDNSSPPPSVSAPASQCRPRPNYTPGNYSQVPNIFISDFFCLNAQHLFVATRHASPFTINF